MSEVKRYQLVYPAKYYDGAEESAFVIPADQTVVLARHYDALAQRLAEVEASEKDCQQRIARYDREFAQLQAEHARLTKELQAIKDTVGDENFYLRQENARLREGHCKDCCCARSWDALEVTGYTGKSIPDHIRELKQQLAAAQGTWTKERPTEAGWYWWKDAQPDSFWILKVEQHPDTDEWCYREGHELFGLDDIVGGEWCRIQEPRGADGKEEA